MKVLASGRQTGRTEQLIKFCSEAESKGEIAYIVCHSHEEAYRIAQRAKELDLAIGFPLTYNEFLKGAFYGATIRHFFVDNVEMLVQQIAGQVPVSAITVTT